MMLMVFLICMTLTFDAFPRAHAVWQVQRREPSYRQSRSYSDKPTRHLPLPRPSLGSAHPAKLADPAALRGPLVPLRGNS